MRQDTQSSAVEQSDSQLAEGAGTTQAPEKLRQCAKETLIGVVKVDDVTARVAPRSSATPISTFEMTNEQGARQVFNIERKVRGGDGKTWYRVLLPLRPNGTRGFVPGDAINVGSTPYRLTLKQHAFKLTLWKGCRRMKTYGVGIGTGETPTPTGRFYLTSLLKPPDPNTVYGTYAYGLSAYSEKILNWRWGGLVGLHGTNDPSSIGRNVSHGCIRMRNADIEQLVPLLPLGTPITIS